MFYSIGWKRFPTLITNVIKVQITFLDEEGQCQVKEKYYKEWIGVVTSNISKVIHFIGEHFPGHSVSFEELGEAKKILPYFEDRVARGKLHYRSKPFYKVYTSAPIQSVGQLFNRFKISYYSPKDWLVRIYVDLCFRYHSFSFYYKWYELREDESLLNSLVMMPDRIDPPDWTFAAIHLEEVNDRIVTISICKWSRRLGVQRRLLYLLQGVKESFPDSFQRESEMLQTFHELLQDVQVLTGFRLNDFLPCLFARCLHLGLFHESCRYTKIGKDVLCTFGGRLTLDLYSYFKGFCLLPSYQWDEVVRTKLGEDVIKIDPQSNYFDYCLQKSELVYQLFEKEMVFSFLVARGNLTSFNAMEALHVSNFRYLLELFKTYGTRLGYFINPKFFKAKGKFSREEAFNYCFSDKIFEDVSVMYFKNIFLGTLLSSNLCYGTCQIMSREEWQSTPAVQDLTAIPYWHHKEFETDIEELRRYREKFSYPRYRGEDYAIVISSETPGFLPHIASHLLDHQRDAYHQSAERVVLNSLYCILAGNSPLACPDVAKAIVALSELQLKGAFNYLRRKRYVICNADSDSLMVQGWKRDDCEEINAYLGLPHVELKFQQRLRRLIVICRNVYAYETADGKLVTRGLRGKLSALEKWRDFSYLKKFVDVDLLVKHINNDVFN